MKSQKNKVLSLLIAILFLMSFMIGCSTPEQASSPVTKKEDKTQEPAAADDQIELRVAWWGSQNRHDRTLKVIDMFMEKYPNIKVSAEFLGWDGYWEKMATQAAGKKLPDVMQMDDAYMADYIERGLLVDLGPYVKSGTIDLSNVDESYIGGGKFGNRLYAISLGANAVAMAYDPAMFEKAGVKPLEPGYSWEEYADTVRQLKAKLGNGFYGSMLSNGVNEFKLYLLQKGAYLFNDDGTALGYDDDQYFIDFFTYWNKLRKDGIAPGPEVTANIQGLEDQLIVHGKSAFTTLHSNQIVALTAAANRPLKMIIYPSDPQGKKAEYLKPSQFFSVTSHSAHPEAAAKFIDFFTNDLAANEVLGAERGVPISSKVREYLIPKLEPAAKESFDYIDYVGKNLPPLLRKDPAGAGEINDTLFLQIQEQINYDKITPEQGAKKFRKEANKILQAAKK